ncbi:MAG TPA: hypothetical protein VIL29_00675 [Pseudothermotoga sp.]
MKEYVITIGVFDGVHIGHQQLLNKVKKTSVEHGYKSKAYVISYPFEYFLDDFDGLIMPLTDRVLQISKYVDEVDVLDLLQIKDMPADVFFDKYIAKNCSFLIVGEDFKFGKNASADITRLREMCKESEIQLEVFPEVFDSKNRRISSSLIRKLIREGEIGEVSRLLGRNLSIYGFVEKANEEALESFVVKTDEKIARPSMGTFKAFEKNFQVNGMVKFDDEIVFISKDLHAAPGSILEVVILGQQKGDEK